MYLRTVSYLCAGNIFTFNCCNTATISYCLLRCILLILDHQEASVLFCHSTDRVAKADNNCHVIDQSLCISSKMHNLLGLFNNYSKIVPSTIRKFQDCFPEISMHTGMAYFYLKLWTPAEQKEKRDFTANCNWIEGKTFKLTWLITSKAGNLQTLRY